jgi:hypothetical protein
MPVRAHPALSRRTCAAPTAHPAIHDLACLVPIRCMVRFHPVPESSPLVSARRQPRTEITMLFAETAHPYDDPKDPSEWAWRVGFYELLYTRSEKKITLSRRPKYSIRGPQYSCAHCDGSGYLPCPSSSHTGQTDQRPSLPDVPDTARSARPHPHLARPHHPPASLLVPHMPPPPSPTHRRSGHRAWSGELHRRTPLLKTGTVSVPPSGRRSYVAYPARPAADPHPRPAASQPQHEPLTISVRDLRSQRAIGTARAGTAE